MWLFQLSLETKTRRSLQPTLVVVRAEVESRAGRKRFSLFLVLKHQRQGCGGTGRPPCHPASPPEIGRELQKKFDRDIYRWGNVHGEEEKMNLSFDRLSDSIRMSLARYGESKSRRDLTFEDLYYFAKSEDTATRSRMNPFVQTS